MVNFQVPNQRWDYRLVYEAQIISRKSGKESRTPLEKVTGDNPDISDWVVFELYDMVWYWDQIEGESELGRFIGVSHSVGSRLCHLILTKKCDILSRITIQHITEDEVSKEEF